MFMWGGGGLKNALDYTSFELCPFSKSVSQVLFHQSQLTFVVQLFSQNPASQDCSYTLSRLCSWPMVPKRSAGKTAKWQNLQNGSLSRFHFGKMPGLCARVKFWREDAVLVRMRSPLNNRTPEQRGGGARSPCTGGGHWFSEDPS